MPCKLAGRTTAVSASQFSKQLSPIVIREEVGVKVTAAKFVQFLNAAKSIYSTLAGIVTAVIEVFPINVSWSIFDTVMAPIATGTVTDVAAPL